MSMAESNPGLDFVDEASGTINKEGVGVFANETLTKAHADILGRYHSFLGSETHSKIISNLSADLGERDKLTRALNRIAEIGSQAELWALENYREDKFDEQIAAKAKEYSEGRGVNDSENYYDALGDKHDQAVAVAVAEFYKDYAEKIAQLKEITKEDQDKRSYELAEKIRRDGGELNTSEGREKAVQEGKFTQAEVDAILRSNLIPGIGVESEFNKEGYQNQDEWDKAVFKAASGLLEDELTKKIESLAETDPEREIYLRALDIYRRRTEKREGNEPLAGERPEQGEAKEPEGIEAEEAQPEQPAEAPAETPAEETAPEDTEAPSEETAPEATPSEEAQTVEPGGPERTSGPKPESPELSNLRTELGEAREEYILAKRTSRSFWRNLAGNIRSLFWDRSDNPAHRLQTTRERYERLRNIVAAQSATEAVERPETTENDSQEAYRNEVAVQAIAALTQEMRAFSEQEFAVNAESRWHRVYSRIYRNPWVRAAIGLGLNLGIGVSAGMGLFPVTGALIAGRWAFGTAGLEGALHGAQDIYSSRRGARSSRGLDLEGGRVLGTTYEDIANRMAAHYEDRIRKHQTDYSNLERGLIGEYYQRLGEMIHGNLMVSRENPNTATADILMDVLNRQNRIEQYQTGSVEWNRRWAARRWLAAGVGSALLTGVTNADNLRHIGLPKVGPLHIGGTGAPTGHETPMPTASPGTPEAPSNYTTVNLGPDGDYSKILGEPSIHSLHGLIQNDMAHYKFANLPDCKYADLWKAGNFNPHDVNQLNEFWRLWQSNPVQNQAELARGVDAFFNLNGNSVAYGPLTNELIKGSTFKLPLNWAQILNS